MSETDDDWQPKCWDCERRMPRRYLQPTPVHIDREDEPGYDRVPVPMCSDCRGRRFGYDCPQCGLTYDEKEDAQYCCRRRPGEAPDCRYCDRRMAIGSGGWSPAIGRTVDWAECECCPVGWGSFTGWHVLDDQDPCKHVDPEDG